MVIVEGSLLECLKYRGGLSEASLIGSIACWSRRYCPFLFAGDQRHAAELCYRYLAGQITEGHRVIKATTQALQGAA
jgi:hypothetical protein